MRGHQATTDETADVLIQRAEAAIAALQGQFLDWVQRDLSQIDTLLAAVRQAQDPAVRAGLLERIRQIAHNIKGQGGTFGYTELTDAAAKVDKMLKAPGGVAIEEAAEAIAAMSSALNLSSP